MVAFNKFNQFAEDVCHGVHDLSDGGDALKIALTAAANAPTAADAVLADLTQISGGTGYTTGGLALTVDSSAQTGGVFKLVIDDLVITASGGSCGPFRYIVLFNDTPSSPADPLIGWWDYGADLTLADGESITLDFSAANGAVQVS